MDNYKQFLEILTPCCLAALFVINLLIKSDQVRNKLDLVEHQNKIKEDLTRENSDTKNMICTHVAEDKLIFQHLGEKLEKIDRKLDTKT